jgi:alpha-beta hydrolase superfamily lysophospholipase
MSCHEDPEVCVKVVRISVSTLQTDRFIERETTVMTHRRVKVEDLEIFYREAGPATGPNLLLLHGFPTSSHMFRNLLPALSDRYHVVAPDLPGFGFSDAPDRQQFRYTFEHLSDTSAVSPTRSA